MSLVLSLFPGLELLDGAFREVGFCVVSGPDRVTGGDVRGFHVPAGVFSGVIGGSPCQSFSALANLVRARGGEPRFGNLIPDFERVVAEACPRWFLHENVPAAPVPRVSGYVTHDFVICNSAIEGEDGLGQEQERVRRFAFGVHGCGCPDRAASPVPEDFGLCVHCHQRLAAPDLRRWILRAALRLSAAARTGSVSSEPVNNSPEAKRRVRQPTIAGERGYAISPARLEKNRAAGVRGHRRTLAEMCRLQGYDPAILEDCPFTADAKRRLIANGVPRPLGLAIARAVLEAIR